MIIIQTHTLTFPFVKDSNNAEGETTNTAVTNMRRIIEKILMIISIIFPEYFPASLTMESPLFLEEIIPEK